MHVRPPVIAGMNRFQMVSSIGGNKLLISGMVLMKWHNLFLKPLRNTEYAAWGWLSTTVDNMRS